MTEFYIYYRIDSASEAEFLTQARAMQARLQCATRAGTRLLRGCADPSLRMEIYSDVSDRDGFIAALEAAVAKYELELFLPAGERRHIECFEPCS